MNIEEIKWCLNKSILYLDQSTNLDDISEIKFNNIELLNELKNIKAFLESKKHLESIIEVGKRIEKSLRAKPHLDVLTIRVLINPFPEHMREETISVQIRRDL